MTNTLYATFHVDDAFFGVDATDVQEVIRTQPMTRVPLASDEVSGLINLRGQVVVAIDMRRRLGMPEPDEGAELLNVIVRTEHGPVSLIVDDIGDVLEADLDELETHERREGLFGAIYWWMVKFGAAFAGLLSGLILSVVGFDQTLTVQSDSALAGLRAAFILVPATGTLIGIWVMRSYELDETRAREIREALDARAV